ncbi:MAG TPA: phosphatidylserine decarboxylase, partial [Vicinamibacteria bacterium]
GSSRIMFKQIAGLIARRIVFKKRLDDEVAAGERVGLIKFGSRVDVFLPAGVSLRVKVGDRVSGGTSVIAERP